MPTRERRAKAVLKRALANLDKSYTLYYVSRGDDGLTDEQIQQIFDGDAEGVESTLDDYAFDYRMGIVDEIIKELIEDEDERELLDDFPELRDELRFAIEERDDSDGPLLEQLSVTGSRLMRYYLDFDLEPGSWSWDEPQIEEAMHAIANATGIEVEPNRGTLWSLVVEASYGGSLYVIWYGDAEEVVRPVLNTIWGNADVPTTIAWENPSLVVLDHMNGSGMDGEVKGTVTKPFDPSKFSMDGKVRGHGYTWDQTASVVYGAYGCEVTLTYPEAS